MLAGLLVIAGLPALSSCQTHAGLPQPIQTPAEAAGPVAEPPPSIAPVLQVRQRPDLWRDIRASFELEHHLDEKRVQQELRWLKRHPRYLARLEARLAQHLAYIHQRVIDRGMPGEIALLPIVESALDPYAFSPGGAAGLWQFIPATGRRFGLERDWWVDGRRDPVAATEAALDYLTHLHERFEDWSLALAGYNTGEGNVARARRRAPEGASFWSLRLPRETSAYVPRLLALAALVDTPARYGITLPAVSPEIPFTVLDTGGQLDLSVAAEATGIDVATLYQWNPALNQWSTPPNGPHHLLVPKNAVDDAQARIDAIPPAERVQWLRIRVKAGDTLSELASRYRTDVSSLRKANNLRGSRIREGQPLLIPKSPESLANPVAQRVSGTTYVVRPGDSLWTISRAHGVPMNRLMRANHIGPKDVLRAGQALTIPGASNAAVIRKVHYRVRSGDSLARIAGRFDVKIADITRWNNLDAGRYLQPGQPLVLFVDVIGGD